jgi:hypothetical protein
VTERQKLLNSRKCRLWRENKRKIDPGFADRERKRSRDWQRKNSSRTKAIRRARKVGGAQRVVMDSYIDSCSLRRRKAWKRVYRFLKENASYFLDPGFGTE